MHKPTHTYCKTHWQQLHTQINLISTECEDFIVVLCLSARVAWLQLHTSLTKRWVFRAVSCGLFPFMSSLVFKWLYFEPKSTKVKKKSCHARCSEQPNRNSFSLSLVSTVFILSIWTFFFLILEFSDSICFSVLLFNIFFSTSLFFSVRRSLSIASRLLLQFASSYYSWVVFTSSLVSPFSLCRTALGCACGRGSGSSWPNSVFSTTKVSRTWTSAWKEELLLVTPPLCLPQTKKKNACLNNRTKPPCCSVACSHQLVFIIFYEHTELSCKVQKKKKSYLKIKFGRFSAMDENKKLK